MFQGAFDSMFGESAMDVESVDVKMLPLTINKPLLKKILDTAENEKKWVLMFVIGTKPCFYKFYGSIQASLKENLPFFILNAEQHYDAILTYGLKELNLEKYVAINLSIRGGLAQKSAELFLKMNYIAEYLKKISPKVPVVPVVLGDTILTGIVPPAWTFTRGEKAIQNEAGLRGMTPKSSFDLKKITPQDYANTQKDQEMILMRNEPYPEQWDTFVSAAGSEYLFAPLEINRNHLIREGYNPNKIWTVGGAVVDAFELKMHEKPPHSIFTQYPILEKHPWIRMDIHRKDNLTPIRFRNIIQAIKKLVEDGYYINLIEMNATKYALEQYNLMRVVEKLKEHQNFLYTPIWLEYSNVIEFFRSEHNYLVITDSGGVQEELNLLGKPCLTCRFNTDRPETITAGSNILVPPITGDFLYEEVKYVYNSEEIIQRMRQAPPLYGTHSGEKMIKKLKQLMNENATLFSWAHTEMNLLQDEERDFGFK